MCRWPWDVRLWEVGNMTDKPQKEIKPGAITQPPQEGGEFFDAVGAPQHWLVKPKTIRWMWILGIAILAFTTWLGTTAHPHAQFGIEGSIGFYSWYGFIACVAMVLFAKFLGLFLSKKDTYYDQ